MKKQKTIIIVLFVSMGFCSASAQDITATERSEIIDNVVDQLVNRYVDPNLGQKAAETIKQKKEKQAYDALDTKASLIEALIADMYATTRDKQIQLMNQSEADSGWMHPAVTMDFGGAQMDDRQKKKIVLQFVNYGLINPHVLEGNIGCLAILEFLSPEIAPEVYQVIDKTMQSFQECTAMILDLSVCDRGGDPEVMMYLASYLFGSEEPLLLYELYDRENKKIDEFRMRTDIPQKRMSEVSVYILVGPKTSSVGEMLAYGLQKISRAKIVGETSAGAAYGTETIDIGHRIKMVLPVARLEHVRTKANWQVTGVIPDVSVKADDALTMAKDMIHKVERNNK